MNYLTPEHRAELFNLFENPYETEKEAREVLAAFLSHHPEYTLEHVASVYEKTTTSLHVNSNASELNVYYEDGGRTPVKMTYEHDSQYLKLVRRAGGHDGAEKEIAKELRDMADALEHHTGPYKNSGFVVYRYESVYDGFSKSINLIIGGYIGG